MADINFDTKTTRSSNTDFEFTDAWHTNPTTDFNFTEDNLQTETSTDFNFGSIVDTYYILKGTGNKFYSIWADPNSSLENNKIYIGRKRDLSIIKTINKQVSREYYFSNNSEPSLSNDDIVDINVTY